MIGDERLDQLLTDYCKARPEQDFAFTPQEKHEKLVPFSRYRRTAAAAAALVLVSVLSIAVYFLFGNKLNTPIAVSPSPHDATTPSAQGESDGALPDGKQDETTGEKTPSNIIEWIAGIFDTPTEAPNGGISATEVAARPTTPTETSPGVTEKGTEHPMQISTERPTQKPTRPPTDAPWEPEPTDPPYENETLYVEPEIPTEGGAEEPWQPVDATEPPEPTDPPSYAQTFAATFPSDKLGENRAVYCRLYNGAGRMIGDSSVYASSHIAAIIGESGSTVTASYTAPDGLITQPGYYNYIFYNENGKRLAQGQVYVG